MPASSPLRTLRIMECAMIFGIHSDCESKKFDSCNKFLFFTTNVVKDSKNGIKLYTISILPRSAVSCKADQDATAAVRTGFRFSEFGRLPDEMVAGCGSDYYNRGLKTADEAYFLELTERYGQLVSRICLSYADSGDDFEDLRQDVWINVWKSLDGFREDSSIDTWIYRVTLNTCVSCLRKGNEASLPLRLTESSRSRRMTWNLIPCASGSAFYMASFRDCLLLTRR